MNKANELPIEIIEEIHPLNQETFQRANEYTKEIEKNQEETLSKNIPDKEIIEDINKTELSLDLSLIGLAKSLSYKLLKLENYLSKLEDIVFSEETLKEMNKSQLLSLYGQSRLLRESMLKQLLEIKEKIDIERIEAKITSLHIEKNNSQLANLDDVINEILENPNFLDIAINSQKEEK